MEHYGFAQPFAGVFVLTAVALCAAPSGWAAYGLLAGLWALFVAGQPIARRLSLLKVRRWAGGRGITGVERLEAGGFVPWGWSLWSFAEMHTYRGGDAGGEERELCASYYAPAFGLLVFCRYELRRTRRCT